MPVSGVNHFHPPGPLHIFLHGWINQFFCTLHTSDLVYCTQCCSQCTVYCTQFAVYGTQFAVYGTQCTVHSVQCTCTQCTVYTNSDQVGGCWINQFFCTLRISDLVCTVHSVQCTVHNVLYTVYCTVYTTGDHVGTGGSMSYSVHTALQTLCTEHCV